MSQLDFNGLACLDSSNMIHEEGLFTSLGCLAMNSWFGPQSVRFLGFW